ncbi:hypothetical protein GCM10019017_68670 [Streptomyces showdoensis]
MPAATTTSSPPSTTCSPPTTAGSTATAPRATAATTSSPPWSPPHATVPVLGGRLELGTWQSICLVDTNRDNPQREVRLSFLG